MLQSPRLKYHMNTIGIRQSLSNSALFKHRCLQNINTLYKHYGKCDVQQQFKDILEISMVYTPEGFTDNSPRYPMIPAPVKKPSAIKSLCLFTNIFYMKNKTAIHWVGSAKPNRTAIKSLTMMWALKPKQKVNSEINNQIKKSLYNCIMHHPQVLQSPIFNDFLKVNIDGHVRPKIVPKHLLRVLVR